jgi:hypothetical protein
MAKTGERRDPVLKLGRFWRTKNRSGLSWTFTARLRRETEPSIEQIGSLKSSIESR